MFTGAAINSVNAARATYGLDAQVVELDSRFRMFSEYTNGGVAAGRVEGIEYLYDALDARVREYDAVAITKPKPEWNLHRHRNGQRCQHRHSGKSRNPRNSAERTFLDTGLRRCHEGFCSFRLRKLIHCRLPKQALWFNLMQFSPWY